MGLKARLTSLPPEAKMALLGAAANEALRQALMAEILRLKEATANMQVPTHLDGAAQFLIEYKQLRAERTHLEDLLGAFTAIVQEITDQENT